MKLSWALFTDATSESSARRLFQRSVEVCEVVPSEPTIAPYEKGGYKISFTTSLSGGNWSAVVVEALTVSQLLGHMWQLTGDISNELDAWSNELVVAGVKSAHIVVGRSVNV